MFRSDVSFTLPEAAVDALLEVNQAHVGNSGSTEILPSQLPQDGLGDRAALDLLAPLVLGGATDLGGEMVFAHMNPPTPWVTWVTTFWNAAVNQNLLHPETAPVAQAMERQVMQWLAPAFGADGGLMVPGSTVANLTALWAAREMRHVTEVVASADAHISIRKAAHLLGLRYREVAVDRERRLRPELLGDLSASALVLTAGTTSAGAVDPLDAGAGAAWRHVDAAWAGPLCLSERHKQVLAGMELADSVTVSAHKWFFQPKESALVFFSDFEAAKGALSFAGPYLAEPNVGLLGSHGAIGVPLMATLLAWGRVGLEERLNRCMSAAEELAKLVEGSGEFELFG
ncbi:MAG: pyridoxal-dependent decarboxylase [Granulicella sp.]